MTDSPRPPKHPLTAEERQQFLKKQGLQPSDAATIEDLAQSTGCDKYGYEHEAGEECIDSDNSAIPESKVVPSGSI